MIATAACYLVLVGVGLAAAQSGDDRQQSPPAPAPVDVADLLRQALKRPPPDPGADDDRRRSLLPTIGASPAVGVSFGVLLSAQERSNGPESPMSVLTVSASYSTKHRVQLVARLDQQVTDAWRLFGDWRYYSFTERTYGLGSNSAEDTHLDVPQYWGRGHATLYRRVAGALAVGAGYHLDIRQPHDVVELPEPSEDHLTIASGVSADARIDSRDNLINASRGWFGRASFTWYPRALGSSRSWQSLDTEGRAYARLPSADCSAP